MTHHTHRKLQRQTDDGPSFIQLDRAKDRTRKQLAAEQGSRNQFVHVHALRAP
jgi:hypothetical protein